MQSALKTSIDNTEIYDEVIRGLEKNQKSLPSKYFMISEGPSYLSVYAIWMNITLRVLKFRYWKIDWTK